MPGKNMLAQLPFFNIFQQQNYEPDCLFFFFLSTFMGLYINFCGIGMYLWNMLVYFFPGGIVLPRTVHLVPHSFTVTYTPRMVCRRKVFFLWHIPIETAFIGVSSFSVFHEPCCKHLVNVKPSVLSRLPLSILFNVISSKIFRISASYKHLFIIHCFCSIYYTPNKAFSRIVLLPTDSTFLPSLNLDKEDGHVFNSFHLFPIIK